MQSDRPAGVRIELLGVKPAIWRRIVVPGSVKLHKLHAVLLWTMGWAGGHLHEFVKLPQCLDGANACPPEDVGGPPGYADFLEAIRDPAHEEHDTMLQWCGGAFDPAAFSVDDINATLRRFKL